MKIHRDLREFIELLNSANVDYVLVGGHAVAYHGAPRFTGDIDFFLRPTVDTGGKMLALLHAFGFGDLQLTVEDFATPGKVIQLGRPPNESISSPKFPGFHLMKHLRAASMPPSMGLRCRLSAVDRC